MSQSGGNFLDALLQGIKTVQNNGNVMPTEKAINFIGATVTDDPNNGRTNVAVSANPNAVPGTGFWHSTSGTLDSAARLVNLSTDTTGILPLTDLAQGGALTNEVLTWTGTQWAGSSTISTGPSGITPGTAGQILVSNATPQTAWTSLILYETTHGRFTSGGSGSDFKTVIGPLVGGETAEAAVYMLPAATAASGTNFSLYSDASTFLGFNSPASFNWVVTGSTNIGQMKVVSGSQVSLWLGSGAAFSSGNVAFTSDAATFTNFNAPSGGAIGFTLNNATYIAYSTGTAFYFGGTNTAAPARVDLTTSTTPLLQAGTSATSLTVGTNKSGASLVLQQDAAITAWTLSGGNALSMLAPATSTAVTIGQAVASGVPAAWSITAQAAGGSNDGAALSLGGGAHSGANKADGSVKLTTPFNPGLYTATLAAGANTLTNAQSNANVFILTSTGGGAYTANLLREITDTSAIFVRNNSAGTLTVSYLSGGTVTVATGTGSLIISDGANLQKVFTTT